VDRGRKVDAPPLLISAKLAKALANPWRNRILLELHLRPMSPKQFAEEFSGPDLSAIARYFRQLREWGFVEVAEELRGGTRRGAVEKVHRAIQRVQFDTPTWENLPLYLREECSGTILEGLIIRITQAVEAESFDAEKDRHLSWKSLPLDRQAWTEYVTCLDEVLDWVSDLEAEAAARIATTAEAPIPATITLLAFRSPPEPVEIVMPPPRLGKLERTVGPEGSPLFLISAQMAKALANPWRNRILIELHLRQMSPRQFVEEFGGPELTTIARYFRQLKKWGFLEVVEELRGGRRRGAVEKVYRAIRRAHFDTATWEGLPRHLREECSGAVLDGLIHRITQAVDAETFDAETDRHLAWKAISLDRQAWTEYVTRLDELLAWVNELEVQSRERVAGTREESIPATVALMAFRSPEGKTV
jgi:DNA-binding transcriptional ArsR family regulator